MKSSEQIRKEAANFWAEYCFRNIDKAKVTDAIYKMLDYGTVIVEVSEDTIGSYFKKISPQTSR